MPVVCPICCSRETIDAFEKRGYSIVDCAKCRHRFAFGELSPTHVADNYSDSYFFGGQAGYRDYVSEERLLRRRGRKYATKLGQVAQGKVLDVGSAAGFLLRGFVDEGWTGTGVEPNGAMAEFARIQLGLNVIGATFDDFAPDERYDLITMFQVVAHFENPRLAIEKASKLLVPEGLLLIETWDRLSLSARVCGSNWHEYSPPSVLHWFSRAGLTALGKQFGFTHRKSGRMTKWISVGHAKSLLSYVFAAPAHGSYLTAVLNSIPNGLSVPYPGDDLFWSLFRKTS